MSIQTQIDRLRAAKAALIAEIEAKGVAVPADASVEDLAALVEAISTGAITATDDGKGNVTITMDGATATYSNGNVTIE